MSVTLSFLGGAPFQLLYDAVKLAMSNSSKFKLHLRNLKFTLDCLQPQIIEQIRLQNLQLNIAVHEIEELQRKINDGIALFSRLSNISMCNIRVWGSCCSYLMVSYADQLDELNESLRRLLEILRLQSLSQVNRIGILARETRDRQDELGRRQLEIISNQRHIIDTLMKQQEIIERIEKTSIAASAGKGDAPVQMVRLGGVFQALYDAVDLAKTKKSKFKVLLEDLKFTLDCLIPLIQELVECNKVLHFPKEEILEDFIVYLEKGLELVYKCSMSSFWNRFKMYEYINSLYELDESLQRLFNILRLQIETDVKDAMVSVSKLEKEIEEIEGSLLPLHQSATPELPLAEAELDAMFVQETRDMNESMDLTGNAEMEDESHNLIEGSSLTLHRVDVEVEEPPSHTVGLETVSENYEETDENQSRNRVSQTSGNTGKRKFSHLKMGSCFGYPSSPVINIATTPGTSEVQIKNRASQTSSSTGRSLFSSEASQATTSTIGLRYDDDLESTCGEFFTTSKLRVYSFADLKSATRNFRVDQILGEGGLGRVFKGWVDEEALQPCKAGTGMMIAIKILKPESFQGFQQWQQYLDFLGRLSHPNLVKLLGYCREATELLLVYEFMQKGSLDNHLFRGNPNIEPLPWVIRIKIATGAARGLAFLHSSEMHIMYRYFKASNILLDGNFNAKISDFGLVNLVGPSGGESHVSTRVMEINGYLAPEYITTGHLYPKSDVYGFGVVLLEILTGLRVFDIKRPEWKHNLVDWVKPFLLYKRKLKSIVDPKLKGQYSFKEVKQIANIVVKCLAPNPTSRPSMKEVLEKLEKVQAFREDPKKPAFLFTSGKQFSGLEEHVLEEP